MSESILSSVVRAFSILKLFNHNRKELSFMEIKRLMSIPKSSLHRSISSLINGGFLTINPRTQKYRLGLDILTLGGIINSRHRLYLEAFPLVKKLSKELEESVQVSILENNEVTYILREQSNSNDYLLTQIGHKNPIHCTGEGLCILAYQEENEIEKILQSNFCIFTDYTLTTKDDILRELESIRLNNCCIAEGTYFKNYTSIAAPIRNHLGQVVSSLSTIGRTSRFNEKGIEIIVQKIKIYAQKISEHLGCYKYSL